MEWDRAGATVVHTGQGQRVSQERTPGVTDQTDQPAGKSQEPLDADQNREQGGEREQERRKRSGKKRAPWILGGFGLRRRRFSLIAVLFGLGLLSATALYRYKPHVYDILLREGPRAALAYLQSSEDAVRAEAERYHLAWTLYRNQQYDEAMEIVLKLNRETGDDYLRGSTWYLMGHLNMARDRTDEAWSNFERAEDVYSRHLGQASADLSQVYLGFARLAIRNNDMGQAGKMLNRADAYIRPPDPKKRYNEEERATWRDLGALRSMQKRMAFKLGDYQAALRYSHQALEAYTHGQDQSGIAVSLVALGLFHSLNGDLATGRRLVRDAQAIIVPMGDEKLFYNNRVGRLLYLKCQDEHDQDLVEEIQVYIDRSGDRELHDLLNFALEWPCP